MVLNLRFSRHSSSTTCPWRASRTKKLKRAVEEEVGRLLQSTARSASRCRARRYHQLRATAAADFYLLFKVVQPDDAEAPPAEVVVAGEAPPAEVVVAGGSSWPPEFRSARIPIPARYCATAYTCFRCRPQAAAWHARPQ